MFSFAKSGTSVSEGKHAGKFLAAPGSKLCSQRSCHGSLSTPSQALGEGGRASSTYGCSSASPLHSRLPTRSATWLLSVSRRLLLPLALGSGFLSAPCLVNPYRSSVLTVVSARKIQDPSLTSPAHPLALYWWNAASSHGSPASPASVLAYWSQDRLLQVSPHLTVAP